MRKYEQIAQKIEINIKNGYYDKKLPTIRELARSYSVSINTINKALELLVKKDLIYTKQGSGFYLRNLTTYSYLKKELNNVSEFNFKDNLVYDIIDFSLTVANSVDANNLDIDIGSHIFKITRIVSDNLIKHIEYIICPYKFVPHLREEDVRDSIVKYAENLGYVFEFNATNIDATSLDNELAFLLESSYNEPALEVSTNYFLKNGVKFAFIRSIHVNTQFNFTNLRH